MPWSEEAGTSSYPPHQALRLELVVATLKRGADGVPGGCHREGFMPAAMAASLGLSSSLKA